MHKTLLTMGVAISFLLCLGAGYSVSARAVQGVTVSENGSRPSIVRYFHLAETFVAGYEDDRGVGMITVSHEDPTLGTVTTVLEVSPQTKYSRLYGAPMSFLEIKAGDSLSITALRDPDGQQLPTEIIDNNTWFMEEAVASAEITAVNADTITATEQKTGTEITIPFSKDTMVVKPHNEPGTSHDLTVGRQISVRGVMRKSEETTALEQSYVIWLLPAHGE